MVMEIRDLVLSILLFAEQWGEEAERYVDHNDPDWGWDNLASPNEIQNTLFRLETAGEVTWRLNQHKRREWIWKRLPYQALLEKLGYDNPYVLVSMYSYLIDSDSSPDEKRIVGLDETSPWQTLGLSSTEEVAEVLRGLVPLHNSGGEPITAIQDIDGVECFVILRDSHVVLVENFSRIEEFLRKPVEAVLTDRVAPHEENQ